MDDFEFLGNFCNNFLTRLDANDLYMMSSDSTETMSIPSGTLFIQFEEFDLTLLSNLANRGFLVKNDHGTPNTPWSILK